LQLHRSESLEEQEQPQPVESAALPSASSWEQVEALVKEGSQTNSRLSNSTRSSEKNRGHGHVPSGKWEWPSINSLLGHTKMHVKSARKDTVAAVDLMARDSTFAIVTFTSRQAAVAARNCMADGRGADRWVTLDHLPIPPLADAAAWDLLACRNCCRPLALGVNERQKNCRHYM
jgi:hypothetical protein